MISTPDLTQAIEEKQNADVNPNVGEEAFTLVTAGVHTTIKESSLYRLIDDLVSESRAGTETKEDAASAALLSAYRVEDHIDVDDHECWFIHFDTAPENYLFPGFELKERHLRIDARFANDSTQKAQQGFTASHYTEEYVHPVTGERKVVHGYIGRNGAFILCQIKAYQPDGGVQEEKVRADSSLHASVEKNSVPALDLVAKLLKEKRVRYKNAVDRSYKIEADLSDVLQEILTNNTETSSRLRLAEQYQALVLCFSKEIAIINRYNDQKIDKRETQLIDLAQYMNTSKIMSESVESVKESAQYNQSQGEPESPSDTMQTDLALATPSMAAKCKRDKQLKQARDLLIEEIKTLAEELNRLIKKTKNLQDTQALIALQGIKLKLRPKLVELAFFPDITPADNRLLKNVTEKIKGTLDVLDSFKDAVKLGDVVRVIQLYPHVQSENLTPIFCDFVVNQLVISKEEKVKNLIRIADYFYQNSHCYREEISAFNHVVTPICNNIKCSVLFMAFLQKNYLAFELLLTQGFSPNGIGLVWEDETIASIINTVVYFMGRNLASYNDVRYIEKLLNLGALVDLKPPKLFMVLSVSKDAESFTKIIQENLKKAVRPEKTSTQSSKPSASLKELDDPLGVTDLKKHLKSHHSALEILCVLTELPKIELLTCLAPHSGLSSLMNAFSFLANRPEVSSKLIIGTSKKCFIACPNKKLADETSEKLFPYQKNVSLIVYQTNAQKGDAFLKSINVVINAVFKQYREIVQNDPEHITVLYALLIEKAKKGSDLDERAHFYLSALYLQLLNSTSSFEDTQKIVQTLYFLGNEYHVASQNQYAQYYFQKAVDCCQKLENSEKLQATSLYQDLQTGLESGVIFLPKETQTLMVTLQNLWPSLVLETPGGSPITPAAVIHATQGPSLTELANAELPPQALLASTQVNLKKKKKLRNGV